MAAGGSFNAVSLFLLLCHAVGPTAASSANVADSVNVEQTNPELEATTCMAELQNKDGTCRAPNASRSAPPAAPMECGLYLAQSAIPNSGWGMYTGVDLREGKAIPPVDVVVPVIDAEIHRNYLKHYKRLEQLMGSAINVGGEFKPNPYFENSTAVPKLPQWLMEQYYWDAGMTHNWYDAEHIDSVIPGLGMLANSHPGMVLAENIGPERPAIIGGQAIASSTPYQDQQFTALKDIPAGHELFVEYGDSWFSDRFHESFGLSRDYSRGNHFAQRWQTEILDKYRKKYGHLNTDDKDFFKDLSELSMGMMEPMNPRLHEVVARVDLLQPSKRFHAKDNPTAYASVPGVLRSQEWLQKEGLCLDHIAVADSVVAPGERGAFASRDLPKGTIVAPAPVVHMSRDHLTMLLLDQHDSDIVHWKGYQLLLNYVYGHAESSLLFFPYAPAVNLINHYGGSETNRKERRPNVKLQWHSGMAHPEWLESFTPQQVVEQETKAGMVMEIIALEDIKVGDEILLDYGDGWQKAYEEHRATVPPPPELQSIESDPAKILTINDKEKYPSFVQTVCWIHEDQRPNYFHERKMNEKDFQIPDTFIPWKPVNSEDYLSDTLLCTIVGRQTDGAFYNVVLKEYFAVNDKGDEVEIEVRIQNIPRRAVTVVPNLYTGAELRRDGFRHEIELPEEMVPEHWRDLKEKKVENPQCNLYMAESSISNAGWGVYRGYARPLHASEINELDRFCEDMVINVEDFEVNQVLRNRYFNQPDDPEMDEWVLTQYAVTGDVTKSNFEAEEVQSFTPGCGMLANTHSLLYNSHRMPPTRIPINKTDPSLGANTHYHNALFVEQFMKQGKKKVRTLETGGEVLVKTSDDWFLDRVGIIGHKPLKSDYFNIDRVLRRFEKLRKSHGEKAAGLLWMLLWNTVEGFGIERIAAGLPRDMNDIPTVLGQGAGGSAEYQMPGRVRTQEWLEEHGTCLDNIRPGTSTVEMAGNGAFATRKIAKDSVVAPVPMLHAHRQHTDIYNSDDIHDPKEPVYHEGKQLILNYCYGHPESSLLLFPYSPVVNYINHAPSEGSEEGIVANAKLQWSSFNTKEWLEKSPEELIRKHKHAGLAMEVVATRDIAQGEEIFIDYGAEWLEAWQNHTDDWNLDKRWRYEAPYNQWLEWMPTEEEIEARGLFHQFGLPGKFLGCHVKRPAQKLVPVNEARGERFLEFEWERSEAMFRTTTDVYPCEVIKRVVEDVDIHYAMIRKDSVAPLQEWYTAIVTVHPGDEMRPPLRFVSYNMPRRAIEIFDDEYAAPQFFRGAFRQEIGIPDAIFPAAWRDLKA